MIRVSPTGEGLYRVLHFGIGGHSSAGWSALHVLKKCLHQLLHFGTNQFVHELTSSGDYEVFGIGGHLSQPLSGAPIFSRNLSS